MSMVACEQALRSRRATVGERTRERAAKSPGAGEKESFFPLPSHSRLLSREALGRLLETSQMESVLASY